MRAALWSVCLLPLILAPAAPLAGPHPGVAMAAASADADDDDQDDHKDMEPTPEQKMQARFPQPARVGFLIGLPLLDDGDSTIGFIRDVVRTQDGKIKLIVPIGGWFGYFPNRAVAVPIEAVAILARQVDVIDIPRADLEAAPTWDPALGMPIDRNAMVAIALGRR